MKNGKKYPPPWPQFNKKGFTLIELIIVIAIMAILVGVLAPNLLRYIEKANRAADVQLADTVRTAIIIAYSDPVTTIPDSVKNADGSWYFYLTISGFNRYLQNIDGSGDSPFGQSLTATLGYPDVTTMIGTDGIRTQLRSDGADDIRVELFNNQIYAVIWDDDGYVAHTCLPDCSWDIDPESPFTHDHIKK